jgi:hypothetical protein
MIQWFYGENGQQIGPLDDVQLNAAISEGRILPETLLWREGMTSWQPLHQLRATGGLYAYASPQTQPMPYGAYGPYAGSTPGIAIASMVCGIVGFFLCFILSIPAVICGHMAIRQIATSPVPLGGRGMAIAGLVCGYLQLVLLVGYLFFVVFAIAVR